MKRLLTIAGVGLLACTAAPADEAEDAANLLSAAERDAGWTLLFDGRSLDGWRGVGLDSIPSAHWRVEAGTIRKLRSGSVPTVADGQPLTGGDIMTTGTFRDFELSFEWKVAPGANSGVKYNVSEEMSVLAPPRQAALGFEYQVLDDALHPDAANGPTRIASALYDLVPPSSSVARPVGEFNEARIVFVGGRGEHWLNGVRVVEFALGTARFDSLLAASKYAPVAGFADRRAGHIVLQDHGDDVWYRNIKLRVRSP
jgi:hypothetical protein